MLKRTISASMFLALAACDLEEVTPVETEVVAESTEDAERLGPGDTSLADATGEGPTRAAAGARAADAVPSRFHGVWDTVEGGCEGLSEARLDIMGDEIGFYEAIGHVEGVRVRPDGTALVSLAMEGEGESWDQTVALGLSDSGRLVLSDPEEPRRGPDRALERCPR